MRDLKSNDPVEKDILSVPNFSPLLFSVKCFVLLHFKVNGAGVVDCS